MLKDEKLLATLVFEYLSFSFSLAKGESHQQAIERVYKRRARKYFA